MTDEPEIQTFDEDDATGEVPDESDIEATVPDDDDEDDDD